MQKTLLTHLPIRPGDEVATKAEIADVRADIARLESRFERFEERMDSRLDQMQRAYVVTVVGAMTALTAIFSLVVGFKG